MLRASWVLDFIQDLQHACRLAAKAPLFTATATLTIGVGIAVSTALFSVTDAVLLRPLPYKSPDRLVLADPLLSNADFEDLREGTRNEFENACAVMVYRAIVPREDGTAERVSKGQATVNFFRMLGGRVAFGRDFSEDDGKPQAQPEPLFPPPEGRVAILSYEYFQRRYARNAAILGTHMLAAGQPGPRIIGILAPGFKLHLPPRFSSEPSPDIWIPNDRGYDAPNRGSLMIRAIAVLRPGVPLERAQARVDSLAARWGAPDIHVALRPWHKTLVAEVKPALVALTGAVVFLLLTACANVASLLIIRLSTRQRELGIRAALGARWPRLARQMIAEALLLAATGTLFGIALAYWGVRELVTLAPSNVPRLESIALAWRSLSFAVLAGFTECFLFAVAAAWRAGRPNFAGILPGAARMTAPASTRFLRDCLVVAEVALSFVLLVGSGLMLRSFLALRRVDPGYEPHHLLTFLLIGDARDYQQPQRRLGLLQDLQDRLRAIPGIENVGASLALPLTGRTFNSGVQWGADADHPNAASNADLSVVLPGYFETLRTQLVEGRAFHAADNAPGRNVAVIDDALASKAFPNQSAIGKRIFMHLPDPVGLEVIGVAAHQRQATLAEPGPEQIYITDGYFGVGISRHWALRTSGDPAKYGAAVRAEIARLAPGRLAVTEMRTMDSIIEGAQSATRFHLLLMTVFASMAALLAGVGLYGVLSAVVRQRTAEIGIRMALGAAPSGIFRLVVGRGLVLTGTGIVIGCGAAIGLVRLMISMLVGVTPTDPATFASITMLFLVIAAVACWFPARRAASLDPVTALRQD